MGCVWCNKQHIVNLATFQALNEELLVCASFGDAPRFGEGRGKDEGGGGEGGGVEMSFAHLVCALAVAAASLTLVVVRSRCTALHVHTRNARPFQTCVWVCVQVHWL